MSRVLVTGGAGFIGSNFIHHWRSSHPEERIVVLDKLTYAGNLENLKGMEGDPHYRFIKGDINDFKLVESIFQEEGIDVVVHFAAESHVDRSILGPKEFIETNINGTFTLLEVARKQWLDNPMPTGPARRCFLHVSTDEVYGSLGAEGFFTEETPYTPNSPYSASKAASDHLVRAYHHTYGLPVITTNCSNNYGPYQFPEKLIPLMIINCLQGKPLPVYGDGLNIRDWLYVADHCRAIDAVIQGGRMGETYNIGGCNEWKNINIVHLLCDLVDEMVAKDNKLKSAFPLKGSRRELITFVKDRPGHDQRYAIDCTKLEKELGWQPVETFETGIGKTIKWYIENMPWWERITSGAYRQYYQEQYAGMKKG
ncbi:MAG: dTDP-glucose 4,6-dehydratase [Thermodesulfobacteriota bacterium]